MLTEPQSQEILFLCREFEYIKEKKRYQEKQLCEHYNEVNLSNFVSCEAQYFLLLHKLGHLASEILPQMIKGYHELKRPNEQN